MNIHTVLKELAAVAFDARVDRPVLVIESDDWGMTGVPSRQVYENLVSTEVFPAGNPWYRDALETPEDLDRLYDVLSSVRDSRGRPAQLTANFIMSNPDPDRLLSGEEPQTCFDTLPESCEEHPEIRELKGKWEEGIKRELFRPEYHGLYHLNIWRLAEALRGADPRLLEMLRHGARPAAMTAGTDRRFLSEHCNHNVRLVLDSGIVSYANGNRYGYGNGDAVVAGGLPGNAKNPTFRRLKITELEYRIFYMKKKKNTSLKRCPFSCPENE